MAYPTNRASRTPHPPKPRVNLESEEQSTLFTWAFYMTVQIPALRRLFHIPNGGSRNKAEAAHLKAQGVKKGVPDIFLPRACGKWHGLFIELKRTEGGSLSKDQKEWIDDLNDAGYKAVVCKGWEEAKNVILEYLNQ